MPKVMYGFYQGYIGSPRITKQAYTGKNVYAKLEDNALEFVNSKRGTRPDGKSIFVSSFYECNKVLFPNFEDDLTSHLLVYARDDINERIKNIDEINSSISD